MGPQGSSPGASGGPRRAPGGPPGALGPRPSAPWGQELHPINCQARPGPGATGGPGPREAPEPPGFSVAFLAQALWHVDSRLSRIHTRSMAQANWKCQGACGWMNWPERTKCRECNAWGPNGRVDEPLACQNRGCTRVCASGWNTCCRWCGEGSGHGPICDKNQPSATAEARAESEAAKGGDKAAEGKGKNKKSRKKKEQQGKGDAAAGTS